MDSLAFTHKIIAILKAEDRNIVLTGAKNMQESVVCTVFEGDYVYGVLSLANSLVASGFQGVFYVCQRGVSRREIKQEEKFELERHGIVLITETIDEAGHLTNYKPTLILNSSKIFPEANRIFYIDPDIVINADWNFFEEWADQRVSLFCDALWHPMFSSHPKKLSWERIASDFGLSFRHFDGYACAGFLGVSRSHLELVHVWQGLLARLEAAGYFSKQTFHTGSTIDPFMAMDQDVLNLALHACDVPFSLAAPENQGSTANGSFLAHAQGAPKPWRGGFVGDAIRFGKRPSYSVRQYWNYVEHPIRVHSPYQVSAAKAQIKLATLLARLFG